MVQFNKGTEVDSYLVLLMIQSKGCPFDSLPSTYEPFENECQSACDYYRILGGRVCVEEHKVFEMLSYRIILRLTI